MSLSLYILLVFVWSGSGFPNTGSLEILSTGTVEVGNVTISNATESSLEESQDSAEKAKNEPSVTTTTNEPGTTTSTEAINANNSCNSLYNCGDSCQGTLSNGTTVNFTSTSLTNGDRVPVFDSIYEQYISPWWITTFDYAKQQGNPFDIHEVFSGSKGSVAGVNVLGCPVPEFLFEIVKHKKNGTGLVFIFYNNPQNSAGEDFGCTNVCKEAHFREPDQKKFVQCCKWDDFTAKLGSSLPDGMQRFNFTNLLDYAGAYKLQDEKKKDNQIGEAAKAEEDNATASSLGVETKGIGEKDEEKEKQNEEEAKEKEVKENDKQTTENGEETKVEVSKEEEIQKGKEEQEKSEEQNDKGDGGNAILEEIEKVANENPVQASAGETSKQENKEESTEDSKENET